MKNKPIIIVSGEPYSVFSEIFFKLLKSSLYKKYKRPIILIGSYKLLKMQMEKMNFSFRFNLINKKNIKNTKLDKNNINLIDVNLKFVKPFGKITSRSSKYITQCFNIAMKIMKEKIGFALINGPVSKKYFLNGKYKGITEYLAKKTKKQNNEVMLIYNKSLAVCPITTHIPLKDVAKKISAKSIQKKIISINNFYINKLKKKPSIAVTGLNPHCESNFKNSEEKNIIMPAIKKAKKKSIKVQGPFPADTLFTKNNIKKYDVIIGMFHDQVIGPLKALYNFEAINITIGLPFIRISPDHGPNDTMLGKKKSDPSSLKEILIFLKKINEN